MLGLTLALRLAQGGRAVTLFEAAPALGGLAGAWSLGPVVWDRFYHVTLRSDLALRSLLAELGLEDDIAWTRTRTGVYADGRLYSVSSPLELLRFPHLRLVDTLRLALTVAYASRIRRWEPLEAITAVEWLRRWSGARTVERFWLPLLRAKLGDAAPRVSAAFIWATIARLFAARRAGLGAELFGHVRGGYARVLGRLAEALAAAGVEVRSGTPVRRVARMGGHLVVEPASGEAERFDRVVVTAPCRAAARLCADLSSPERAQLEAVEYQGIVCASLLLRAPLAGFYVTNILDSWVPFTGVIEMTALVDPAALGGHALVYLPRYAPPGDPVFERGDADLTAELVGALARMYPGFRPADVLASRIARAPAVFALPTPGYSRRLPPMDTSVPGLHVVNSAHIVNGTLNVNETVQLAERAAARLLAASAPLAGPGLAGAAASRAARG
jgi:protoporphyrinogen oxidase